MYYIAMTLSKAKPADATNTNGPLTTNVRLDNEAAMKDHTQTRLEFTWLFLATPKHLPHVAPVVLRTNAATEEEARAEFSGGIWFSLQKPFSDAVSYNVFQR